jgi:hypothetical protein
MANEFVAKNGIIAKANSAITGTLDVSGNITMGTALVATRTWVTGTALSGYATESYVTTAINNLIDAAPGTLDTLNELAAALGDDPNFATTVTNSIATKLPLAGGTMTGNINWTSTELGLVWTMNTDGAYIKFFNTGDGDTNSRLEYATSDNGDEYHRFLVAGIERMAITSSGISATGYNKSNWDTAYSWGNHASAGYLTSESDTLATVTARGATTTGNITVNGDLNFTGVLKYGGTTVISNSASDVYLNARVLYSTSTLNDGMYINYNTNGGAGAHLRFFANTTNERMRIDASTGNVGIGTQGPGKKLDVVGTIRAQVTSPGAGNGDVYGFNIHEFNGDNNRLGIGLHDTGDAFISLMSDLGTITRVDSNGSSYFMGGNVGVGTTNPIYKLQVVGSAYVNGGTLYIDSDQYIRWGNSNQGIVGSNDSHVAIVSGGSTRQTIYADGRTYFPGLDLSISNVNSTHGTGTYFRGDNTHFVLGLNNGNTLYLNYGNGGGSIQSYGTLDHSGNLNVVGGGNLRIGQSGSFNNLNFVRNDGSGVGAIGWKNDGLFYIGGHPDYGPGAGNDVRVYGFGSNLYFGNNSAGDVARISSAGVFSYGGSEVATRSWVQSQGYLTSETDSQTLSWNAGSKNLTISNGNTVTLDGLATEEFVTSQGYITSVSDVWVNTTGDTMTGDLTLNYGYPRINFYDSNHDSDYSLINNDGSFSLYDVTNNVHRWWVSPGGNVGIGITSPVQKLDINGNISLGSWTKPGTTYVGLRRADDGSFGGGGDSGLAIESYNHASPYNGDYSQRVHLRTHLYNGGSHNVLTAYGTNLGVGTSTPGWKLHVAGDSYTSGVVRIGGTNPFYFEDYGGGFYMQDGTWIRTYNNKGIWVNDGYLGGQAGLTLGYGGTPPNTYGGGIFAGSVGIGTTTPESKLHISGGKLTLKGGASTDQQIVYNYAREYVNGIYNASGHFRLQDNSLGGTVYQWDGSTFAFPNGNIAVGTTTPSSKLHVKGSTSGADVFAVDGVNGRLFTVTDDLSDSLFSVNTIAGLPVIEAFADNTVKIGRYGANNITIQNDKIAINSDTVDANFPFYVGDRSSAGSRYILTNPGMGFNLADNYAQLQLYGSSGAYIDFVSTAVDSGGRIMWSNSGYFLISGDMYFNNTLYTYTLVDRDNTNYYLNMDGTSRLGTVNVNQLSVYGNTYLGDGNGDEVHINDILRVGATDSGDAHFYFGEGGSAGSDYGSHWYWDSGYTFTWNTRNAGTDTALFDYVTNDTTYVNWRRNFHMQGREINYLSQLHFNAGTRFYGNDSHYLIFRTDDTGYGGIQVRDGNSTTRGYSGYYDSSGFGLLNSSGNWGIRLNPGNIGTELYYAGSIKLGTITSGTRIYGNLHLDDNYGNGIVGAYASDRYQGVFAMGDSYKLVADGTSPGSLYGLAWTHTNVGGESKAGLSHQLLIMHNGNTQTAIGTGIWTSGLITTTSYGTSANWKTAYDWGNHASQGYATQSYVTTAIANLVDSAPSTLDTLNELAAALGDDPNFATTVTNSIAGKVSKSGDTMTGNLTTTGLIVGNGVATGRQPYGPLANANIVLTSSASDSSGVCGIEFYSGNNYPSDGASIYFENNTAGGGSERAKLTIRVENDQEDHVEIRAGKVVLNANTYSGGGQDPSIIFQNNNSAIASISSNGQVNAFGGNSSQWNSAYGWGNHAGLYAPASHNHDDRYYTETESDGRYLYYRGYSTSGDTQTFQSTPNTLRFDQVGDLSGAWSNEPTGYYTYGGILSLRGESFALQIYGSHTGDLAFKTQWDNDQYSGWRTIITSANIGSQSVAYATSAGNADTVDGLHASSFLRSDVVDANVSGTILSTNNANVDGANFEVNTTNKSVNEYAYKVSRSGSAVGGIYIDGRGEFPSVAVGGASITSTTVSNWNTAYSWGNHANYGYWNTDLSDAKTVQSTDVIFSGNVTVEGVFTESSSIRFKENIKPLEPALSKVEELNPVTYNKIGSEDKEIGLIAEEVAELFPEVVTYNEKGQVQGVQYQRLSVILLKAMQEQNAVIAALTERVNKLENK